MLSHSASLAEPKDVAWLLASYARDGAGPGGKGRRCVVTGNVAPGSGRIVGGEIRRRAGCGLLPVHPGANAVLRRFLRLGALGAADAKTERPLQLARRRSGTCGRRCCAHCSSSFPTPGSCKPLGLVEVLDWTAAALNRVERDAFFAKFSEGEAVPYFYEPFLQAFDPELRKQLGVWYTPSEVVRYMVARVDKALKDDLGIDDGLAGENVYVLDPCCGTGAYLAEVLRRIAANLEGKGLGALTGARVKAGSHPAGFRLRDHARSLRGGATCRWASPCRNWTRLCRTTATREPASSSPTRSLAGSPRYRNRYRFQSWNRNGNGPSG